MGKYLLPPQEHFSRAGVSTGMNPIITMLIIVMGIGFLRHSQKISEDMQAVKKNLFCHITRMLGAKP